MHTVTHLSPTHRRPRVPCRQPVSFGTFTTACSACQHTVVLVGGGGAGGGGSSGLSNIRTGGGGFRCRSSRWRPPSTSLRSGLLHASGRAPCSAGDRQLAEKFTRAGIRLRRRRLGLDEPAWAGPVSRAHGRIRLRHDGIIALASTPAIPYHPNLLGHGN